VRPEGNALLEIITGRARLGAHERPLVADKTVEQAALSRIGFTEDNDLHASAQHLAVMACGKKPAGVRKKLLNSGKQGRSVFWRQVFLGKIDAGFDDCEQIEQPAGHFLHSPAQRTAELLIGSGKGAVTVCLDEIDDRFSLAQVHPTVKKGSFCEFAGLGGPATTRKKII
jgi:hypothetical protein